VKNSKKQVRDVLVLPRKKIEKFLLDFAHLRLGVVEGQRMFRRHRDFFPPSFPEGSAIADEVRSLGGFKSPEFQEWSARSSSCAQIPVFTPTLRKAWDEPDQRLREWYIFLIRHDFHVTMDPARSNHPPPFSPFEQAMFYLQRNAARARHCANAECPAPYFFAKDNKPQKYCCSKCAGPAKREAKRKWWAENRAKSKST
jgi:hypothetical protein